jgi:hypothetical protein
MLSCRMLLGGFLLLAGVTLASAGAERERSVQSPSHTVALVELYTSAA